MKSEDFLLLIAAVAVVVSLSGVWFTYDSVNNLKDTLLTGYAIESNGTVNLTVESSVALNFSPSSLNFGSGRVRLGTDNATLDTVRNNANGNWTNKTGIVIENIGNTNVTLDLAFTQNASDFLGGTDPQYAYNVSNNETGSCINSSSFNLGRLYDVNKTLPGTRVCDTFLFLDGSDQVRLDLRIAIPSDSRTGALGDVIIATVAAA